jgi:hypothetical protein
MQLYTWTANRGVNKAPTSTTAELNAHLQYWHETKLMGSREGEHSCIGLVARGSRWAHADETQTPPACP